MKYCITLNDWIDKDLNPRVDGFAKLKKAGAQIPVIRLFTNDLFELWLGNSKKFPKKIKLYLFLEFSKLLRNSFSRAVMIRQAYYIPDIPKPYGGRFSAQTPKEAVRSIENHYNFFIGQKWHTHAGHECIIFSYPRTDPPAFPELPKPSDPMPRGGMASLLETNLVEVQGTFGDHETVTAFPCDIFTVIKHADGIQTRKLSKKDTFSLGPTLAENLSSKVFQKIDSFAQASPHRKSKKPPEYLSEYLKSQKLRKEWSLHTALVQQGN